jgi:hypothetical protein
MDKNLPSFKLEINQIFKDDYKDLTIISRQYKCIHDRNRKYYTYKCNKCGYITDAIESAILNNKNKCACCCNKVTLVGFNDITTTVPWMISFFQGGIEEAKLYTKYSNKKVYPICPDCGRIKTKPMTIHSIYENHSIGCSCNDGKSYPEKFIFKLLELLNIEFVCEYSPKWISPKRYDFYFKLNNKEYIIEADGGWHKHYNNLSGQTQEESKLIDEYKDKLANEHNIEVIRIDCEYSDSKYIKDNIINSKLNILFDLNNINWLECNAFALSNRAKFACEIRKNNPTISAGEIAKIMNMSVLPIRNYLKTGNELNWCEYDPKEECKKGSEANKTENKKKFKQVCESWNKNEFNSIKDIAKHYSISTITVHRYLEKGSTMNLCNYKK